MNRFFQPLLSIALTCLLLAEFAWAQPTSYRLVELQPPLGQDNTTSYSLNSKRLAVGQAQGDPAGRTLRATSWDQGKPRSLGTLKGFEHSTAKDVNWRGQIVGFAFNLGDLNHEAFIWDRGKLNPIGSFTPEALNGSGQIAGSQTLLEMDGCYRTEAILFSGKSVQSLGTLGGDNSYGRDINEDGTVVGSSHLANNQTSHAFAYLDSQMIDLGTLGGRNSDANAINDAGVIVGTAENELFTKRACRFSINGSGQVERVDLGSLENDASSFAFDVNKSGVIVGTSNSSAFVYFDSMVDLNSLVELKSGTHLESAVSITNDGVITGWGRFNGVRRGFLLIPETQATKLPQKSLAK